MADSIDTMLANAKQVLSDSEKKFPSSSGPAAPTKPSYTAVREARTPTLSDEMKAKGDMVNKAKQALK